MAWQEPKTAWTDRYVVPTDQELRHLLSGSSLEVFDHAQGRLGKLGGVVALVSWQGLPWRWTFTYRHAFEMPRVDGESPGHRASDVTGGRAFAYLIPDPSRVQLCVPLSSAQADQLPMTRLSRVVREGVRSARLVAGVWWPTWHLTSIDVTDDVLDLIVRKHALLASATDTRPRRPAEV